MKSVYSLYFSLEIQRRLMQTIILEKSSYSVCKERPRKPLKVAAAKNLFSSVYISDTTCFDECFLFHVTTSGHYFSQKIIAAVTFFPSAILLHSLKLEF